MKIKTLLSLISSLVVIDFGRHLSKFTLLHSAADCLLNLQVRRNVSPSVLYLHFPIIVSPTTVVLKMYFPLYDSNPKTLLRQQSRMYVVGDETVS